MTKYYYGQYLVNWLLIDPLTLPSIAIEDRRDLEPIPAVYFLIEGNSEVLYIGETCNLQLRHRGHHHCLTGYKPEGKLRIAWIEIENDWLRFKTEEALIWSRRPRLNRISTPSCYGRGPDQPFLSATNRPTTKGIQQQMTRLCSVRRSATPPSFKPNRPWEGYFDFIINHRPSADWRTIAMGQEDIPGIWPSISGDVITLSCEPDRLQFITEQFVKWLAVVDEAHADFVAHPEKREAFERELDKAVANLVIPNINSK